MDTDLLVRAWREATDELRPPADFAAGVVRGGKRRVARRRVAYLAGLATVSVVLASAVLGGLLRGEPTVVGDPRLDEPTRGDLANDLPFLDEVVRAWQNGIQVSYNADRGIFDDPRGAPHVYWAGSTPAGPAAVVLQRFYLHEHDNLTANDWNQTQTLVGLVGTDPATNRLTLLGDRYRADGEPAPGYFQFGPDDRTVLVLQRDVPVYISTRAALGEDGRTTREWRELAITDGVAIAQVPAEDAPDAVRLLARASRPAPGDKDWNGLLLMEPASAYLRFVDDLRAGRNIEYRSPDHRLPWETFRGERRVGLNPPALADAGSPFVDAVDGWGSLDIGLMRIGWGHWVVIAGLPDGNFAVVSEIQQNDQPSRTYAVIRSREGTVVAVRPGEEIDVSSPLPVVVHLPDGQGWVVAAYGRSLSYQVSAGGDWVEAGEDAALLPDDAARVRVGPATEVALPPR
jgi:hypothetical protein